MIDCFSVSPAVLLDEIEAAEAEGNDDHIEGVLCGAVKLLKMNRAKPDMTLYLSLMFLAKIKPNVFATEGVIEVDRNTCAVILEFTVAAGDSLLGEMSLFRLSAVCSAVMLQSTLRPRGTTWCLCWPVTY